jgi:hypothetical protein
VVTEGEENQAQGELRYVYQRRRKENVPYAYNIARAKFLISAFSNS